MQTGASTACFDRRKEIVDRARAYVGTPFRHQGRKIGLGVDCVGLILCVAEDLNLLDVDGKTFHRGDYMGYGAQPVDIFVQKECARRLYRKELKDLEEGDVVSMRIPHLPTHTAFVTKRPESFYIVHAYAGGPANVVEHILNEPWRRRIVGVFSFPEVVELG